VLDRARVELTVYLDVVRSGRLWRSSIVTRVTDTAVRLTEDLLLLFQAVDPVA